MATNFDIAYQVTYDEDEDTSTATCSAWRVRDGAADAMEVKYGMPYKVRTGYKIYESATSWFPTEVAAGEPVEMTFMIEGATVLVSTAVSIIMTLSFLN